jgi:hypothetical protein
VGVAGGRPPQCTITANSITANSITANSITANSITPVQPRSTARSHAMAVRPKLLMGFGIAIAALGLIGAGAGATFTAQVSASSKITSGGVGLSLNGKSGSDLKLDWDGKDLGSHFAPISETLTLKNTGTLDMPSTFLNVTATGCDKGDRSALSESLRVTLTDVTSQDKVIFDGDLCSLADGAALATHKRGQGFITPPDHEGVGGQLPRTLPAGTSREYLLVIQPSDEKEGLPTEAQSSSTSVTLVFSGFDF